MKKSAKNIITAPFRITGAVIDRIITIAGALTAAQFPEFLSQYLQRLGGHIDELMRIVNTYKTAAITNGHTLQDYVDMHLGATVKEFKSTGVIMRNNIERLNDLQNSLQEISNSDGVFKPVTFLKEIDIDIFRKTTENFTPGIPVSTEGLLYELTGLILTLLMITIIKKALQSLYHKSFVKVDTY